MPSPLARSIARLNDSRLSAAASRELTRAALAAFGALGVTGAGMLAYATSIEPHWIDLTHVDITLPRLPAQFDGYPTTASNRSRVSSMRKNPISSPSPVTSSP
jgi:hypothetical protein